MLEGVWRSRGSPVRLESTPGDLSTSDTRVALSANARPPPALPSKDSPCLRGGCEEAHSSFVRHSPNVDTAQMSINGRTDRPIGLRSSSGVLPRSVIPTSNTDENHRH